MLDDNLPWIIKFRITLWKWEPEYDFPETPVVASVLKLSTVLGTSWPKSPITIRPAFTSPMEMSKNTWSVTVKCAAF